ncbi:NADH:ubiquinone oxidoreductase subunit NDUFA12 [uncultured Paracoccus sp.]|uniref:NADH:ubiquinone oxidoreductase subunit NDUFA12 n=1 Tax=uncultured Paracoccus sp. TaxID=189685 RepID=UPI0025DB75DA|nr:NADH:ubiquinone oxidoreductase subunit NDUFA12 [uncultured Paracoccus sp.]
MSLIARIFTWWNGQTLNTRFWTWRNGKKVGEDAEGNVFYQTADGKRRWVIYNGESEASRIGAEWNGWLHHTVDEPPTVAPLPRREWEMPHRPNETGTEAAYHPAGSLYRPAPVVRKDYDAWQPE